MSDEPKPWGCPTCGDKGTIAEKTWSILPNAIAGDGRELVETGRRFPCPTCAAHRAGMAQAWDEGWVAADQGNADTINPYRARGGEAEGGK
jgi:predicted RNA-binding Zn-ribbon protein involved in translation (DUF1610 family)